MAHRALRRRVAGNPGPAAYGAVIEDAQGREVARLSKFLGRQTNNYRRILRVCWPCSSWAIENGAKRLRVVSDSELMVKQMKGLYKVANPGLRPLWEEARRLSRRLEGFEIRHTLRGGNKEADRLANEAMDKGMGRAPSPASASGGANAPSRGPSMSAAGPAAGQHPGKPSSPKPPRQVIEGYVKDGVVHLLEGELPDGAFVKIIHE